jgi:hypothetical protein
MRADTDLDHRRHSLGFLAPGWGSMKLKSQAEEEQPPAAAPAGSVCGSVLLTLDRGLIFHDTVDIAKKAIGCKADAETFDDSAGAVSQTAIMQTGGCTGDALRRQGQDALAKTLADICATLAKTYAETYAKTLAEFGRRAEAETLLRISA